MKTFISWIYALIFIGVAIWVGIYMWRRHKASEPKGRITRYPCTNEEMLDIFVKSSNSFPEYERMCLDNIITY